MIFEKYNRFNLQLFADDDGGEGGEGGSGDDGGSEPKNVTMTQTDFDAKFNKAFAKGSKKAVDDFKKSDEYKEMMKLKDDNTTETEKMKERLGTLDSVEKELETLRAENATLKNRSKLTGLADSEQTDFVLFEINKLMDDKTDFDDALEKFKESKPQYFEGEDDNNDDGQGKGQNFRSSSQKKRSGNNKKTGAEAYLDKRYKNSPYRK